MKLRLAVMLAFTLSICSRADVPGIITYQGRISSNETNFTGTGHFRFVLHRPGRPPVTLWSHDNTSVAGGMPAGQVTLRVTNGLFSLALGDTTVPGMSQAISPEIFNHGEVYLRIWFDDGAKGPTQLSPDQRITSAAYAMRAANVLDGAITGSQIAPGAIMNIHLANDAVTSANIADPLRLQQLILETALGQSRIDLTGSGTSGRIQMFHNSIGQFLEAVGTTSGGFLRLFDELGGQQTGQMTVELGSSSVGGYVRVLQDNNGTGVQINGQNGSTPGGTISLYRETGLGLILQGSTSAGQGSLLTMFNGLGDETVSIDADASGRGSALSLYNGTNAMSVLIDGNSGGAGLVEVRNNQGAARAELDGQGASGGGEVVLRDEDDTATVVIEAAEAPGNGAQIALYRGSGGAATIVLDADASGEGRITTQVLEITGGSDLSENFHVGPSDAKPGMIVCIDPSRTGQLIVSQSAYDRRVVGVISGAGGVKPGMVMRQSGTVADGKSPVALTGRVFCMAEGPIEPGDLITTSDTPGHGMKVTDHARAQGAIIGKAMTGLTTGKGLVLVLVSLQ